MDLVLGTAVGYGIDQVMPFLRSLRGAGFRGRVVLWVDRSLGQALEEHAMSDVTCVRTRKWLPFTHRAQAGSRRVRFVWAPLQRLGWGVTRLIGRLPLNPRIRRRLQIATAERILAPMEARFLWYCRFLRSEPFERALLTDVRDVLFQDDPFDQLADTELAVSIESRRYAIATQAHNSLWMERTYGPRALADLGHYPVSCVGVVYGQRRGILNYLTQMVEEFLSLSHAAIGQVGADTAVHNMLVWTNRLGAVRQLETLDSPVATLNEISEDLIAISAQGTVLNLNGSEPSILHQYDRLSTLGSVLRQNLG